ncbi:uncharacterized protein BDR25DRAFT_263165 [Lindgomyces ingoldianus]|uniref:Uncharacterized protein n=1 Tax=Lindgomyces ingoldianus TaxID=673940 RepID=A0ACB6QTA0_9PLEO|nr:uncharacterized protein BDR25DRAFT_263165 [Lindgomyces ingoldianus]KAF2469793.1 hypothetical protein BDR25DRAFT_263165 [Lindgomyces ingoldianus]
MRACTSSSPSSSKSPSIFSVSILSALFLSFSSLSAGFDCQDVAADRQHFDFNQLGGPHRVHWLQDPDIVHQEQFNYTFTLDICHPLKRDKGVPKVEFCHLGSRVCAVRETIDMSDKNNRTINPIDIAGTYRMDNGRTIDAKFSLLRNSKSHSDAGREGVRAELHGGRFPFKDNKNGLDQMAIIEFVCDKDRTGLENDEKDDGEKEDDGKDGEKEDSKKLRRREDSKCEDSDKSLRFCSYEVEEQEKGKKVSVLRLEWRTKYACEDALDDAEGSHWGFFAWFIIILFLATAAYLIFGSWLNYNRYGARGWDLLPHGDTIRDLPYIFKDWARRVAGAIQGPGSRGGYSAV